MNMSADKTKVRVLVVDDSVLMGRQIAGILDNDEQIEVVGRAKDGMEALEMVAELKPDVVTLDVEMPRMDGITALKHIMVKYSTPTVMISALTKEGATTTFDALKYGAIDVIAKPSRRQNVSLDAQREDIVNKVKRAAAIRTGRSRYIRMSGGKAGALRPTGEPPNSMTRFVGLGAGTGGYYSLLRIIPGLGSDFSDVVVAVILVSARYIEPFVTYLASHSPVRVKTVKEGRTVEKGTVYICSGQDGPTISADSDGQLRLRLSKVTSEFSAGGAVDRMMKSLAGIAGNRAMGCVLSGPGNDGAEGIHEIRQAGGITVVQDINNCMDPSMPLAVLKNGTVGKIIPDFLIAQFLLNPEAHLEN